ncbi:MAG TPA: hypothetical protein VNA30_05650 [Mycobacteriales bacterium]|nr:hypothetical protein [Mycobacteriales bacterium]
MRASPARYALLLATGLVLVHSGGALAAPRAKPNCKLVQDARGDATAAAVTEPAPLPNNPQLDVLSADLASDGRTLTAVLRLDALAATDANAPTGRGYHLSFAAGEAVLVLSAHIDAMGTATYSAGSEEASTAMRLGEASGRIDLAKREIRIHAPVSAFASKAALRPGSQVTSLLARTQRGVSAGPVARGVVADNTEPSGRYALGAPSCVAVGR